MIRTIGYILLGLALGGPVSGCCCGGGSAGSSKANPSDISEAKFNALKLGMSYESVCSALGRPGTEVTSNKIMGITTIGYMWKNDGIVAGQMNAIFQNNRLQSKTQFGLK